MACYFSIAYLFVVASRGGLYIAIPAPGKSSPFTFYPFFIGCASFFLFFFLCVYVCVCVLLCSCLCALLLDTFPARSFRRFFREFYVSIPLQMCRVWFPVGRSGFGRGGRRDVTTPATLWAVRYPPINDRRPGESVARIQTE